MLTRYTAWANHRLFHALTELATDALPASRPDGLGRMLRTLNHAHVVDLIWQAHLQERPHGFSDRNTETTPSLAELQAAQARLDHWYVAYADDMDAAMHDEVVNFRFVDGGAGAMTRGDILLHVVNHKTYHRGYVAEMIYQVPARPPTMDLPVFLRDAFAQKA
ncbi:DinB family protein [Variovorax terrae]|uniref:DinB family protein n=1 Tax=Variovorax terrae TaxID=2923278 RepID=A0A9X1VZJ7_9BURK|nr:DinB family protein [Variovorax terrae]MCJ0765774.1 DinB family protein [Variovorax terrae]